MSLAAPIPRFAFAIWSLVLAILPACPFDFGGSPPSRDVDTSSGCEPAGETLPALRAPGVVLGTADGSGGPRFSPLGARERLELDYGFQGGQHVYVSAKIAWEADEDAILEIDALDGGEEIGGLTRLVEPCPAGEARVLLNLRAVIYEDRARSGVVLEAELRSGSGSGPVATASGIVDVIEAD